LDQVDAFDALAEERAMPRGSVLFRAGDPFDAIYAIRSGSVKLQASYADGTRDVVGYRMPGQVAGWDGFDRQVHRCDAVALEDTVVRRYLFVRLREVAARSERLQQALYPLLAHELDLGYERSRMLSCMRSEQRVARFVIDLAQRYRGCGCPGTEFVLPMTRREIASYLGLRLETVSRVLSRFDRAKIIEIDGRTVRILAHRTLEGLVEGVTPKLVEQSAWRALNPVRREPGMRIPPAVGGNAARI